MSADRSGNWIVIDGDGSWHGLDSAWAVVLPDDATDTVDVEYGGELLDYLAAEEPVERQGTLVVWEDVRESLVLAMRAAGIGGDAIDEVLGTVEDAIANNTYG